MVFYSISSLSIYSNLWIFYSIKNCYDDEINIHKFTDMKTKQMFIVLVIILLATTLLFPKTKEERHCHQYSGESKTSTISNEYKNCENDSRCKVDKESILMKETEDDGFSFMCVPSIESATNQLPE